jgi:branched-chain amino acid transport system permease protein
MGAAGRVPGLGGLAVGAVLSALVLAWVGSDGYRQTLVTAAATYALVALGMYVPYLMAGSLSMAYGAYAGIGGYAVGLLSTKTDLPLVLAWLLGPAAAAAVAVLLGLVTRRLSGFFLAAVTLLFGMAFTAFLVDAESVSGGSGGLGNLRELNILGWTPSHYQVVVGSVVVVCVIAFLLDRARLSAWGVIVRTMRDAPRAVEAAGVRVPVMNLVALALGAAIAAIGGGLFTYSAGSVTPDTFTLNIVFLAIFMPLIGGGGTPWGAVAGAAIAVELTLNFPAIEASGTLILALGVLVILLIAPRGVIGYADQLRRRGLALLRGPGGADRPGQPASAAGRATEGA